MCGNLATCNAQLSKEQFMRRIFCFIVYSCLALLTVWYATIRAMLTLFKLHILNENVTTVGQRTSLHC